MAASKVKGFREFSRKIILRFLGIDSDFRTKHKVLAFNDGKHSCRDTDQLFLRGRPPRRSMVDRGWARAFRGRADFEHDQVLGVSKLA